MESYLHAFLNSYGGEKTGIPHQRTNTRASSFLTTTSQFYVYVNVFI